jgi:putative transposase
MVRGIFADVYVEFESELVVFDGEDDHVHRLANNQPKVTLSAMVNNLKGVTTCIIGKKNYPSIRKKLWVVRFGHPAILLGVAPARRLSSFGKTPNSSRHLTKKTT